MSRLSHQWPPSWWPPHPCDQHPKWCHTEQCLTGDCWFCDRDLDHIASGECRQCGRIVCEDCDAGYDINQGPICQPCHQTPRSGNDGRTVPIRRV